MMPTRDQNRTPEAAPYIPPEVATRDLRPRWLKWALSAVFVPVALTVVWEAGFPELFGRVELIGQIMLALVAIIVVVCMVSIAWSIECAVDMVRTMKAVRRSMAELRRVKEEPR
jgi:L-cystine uptake protein TcyP (sodium:dicarboxylate symporter family)